MRVSTTEKVLNYIILIAFSLYALFPILTIVVTALSPQSGITGGALHFENLVDAWNIGQFGGALTRSLMVAVVVVSAALSLSILAG